MLLIWSVLTISLPVIKDMLFLARVWQFTCLMFYLIALKTLLSKKISSNKVVKMLLIWSIYISFINLIYNKNSPFSYLETLKDTLWWPSIFIVFLGFFTKALEINYMKFINKYFVVYFSIIMSLIYYLIISFSANTNLNTYGIENQNLINSIYWVLLLLPFCFFLNKILKYLLFAIILVSIVIASKRSPLIVVSITILFSLYRDFFNGSVKNVLLGIVSFSFLYFIFITSVGKLEINSSQRLSSTNVNEEARFLFITESWNTFNSKNSAEIIFGSGHRSSAIDRGLGLSKTTHNDFFETLYSYGIIGLLMYMNIIIHFFKKLSLISKNNRKLYDAHFATLIILIVTSMFSHLIIYPTYFAFIVIIWVITDINTKLKFNNKI